MSSIPDPQGEKEATPPAEPTRFKAFANFFKGYMSVSSIIAAALPIPIAYWKLIPMYDALRGPLGTYTSLFCFLLLAFIFYRRHSLARIMFRDFIELGHSSSRVFTALVNWLPALLILLCFVSIIAYQNTLIHSLEYFRQQIYTWEALLKNLNWYEIPYVELLMGFYLLIFLFAEAAFVLMAIKEYLQDLLKVSEQQIILEGRSSMARILRG